MSARAAFCRLVLGADPAREAAAAARAVAGVDRVDEVAGAWIACRAELERPGGDALAWDEPEATEPAAGGLAAVPGEERAALAAQALGLEPAGVEEALGLEAGVGAGLLARGHACLAGLGRPADAACAAERARLATARVRPGALRSRHCADCRAFGAAVAVQRPELRRMAEEAERGGGEEAAEAAAPAGGDPAGPHPGGRRERGRRVAVAAAVLLVSGLIGFEVVSALETPRSHGSGGVVTATPVGPLPPGVGSTGP